MKGGCAVFCIKLAGLTVEMDNRYSYAKEACRDYLIEYADARPDFRVRATGTEIEARVRRTSNFLSTQKAEFYVLLDKICKKLPEYDALMLHSALIEYKGSAYAFAAPRGVGKTTHAHLWKERFGSEARVLCGDKPIFRRIGGEWVAFGTPWGGKEGDNINAHAKLGGVFFLEQANKDRTSSVSPDEFVQKFILETVAPDAADKALRNAFCNLLGDLYTSVPTFKLLCTPSESALDAVLETIKSE